MTKPKLNLSELGFEETLTLATGIKTAMTGNPNFVNVIPPLTVLGTDITTAQAGLDGCIVAEDELSTRQTVRENGFGKLRQTMSQIAAFVESASGGDEAKIRSAGMEVRSARTKRGVPPEVMGLVLTVGDFPGTLDAAHDALRGFGSYEYQISPDPMSETSWVFKMTSTKSSATLTELKSGDTVWIRVRAVGSAGPGPWSDPAKKVVP